MKTIAKINLDLLRPNFATEVDAMQDDGETRALEVSLTSGGTPWNVPEGASPMVVFRRPNYTKGMYDQLADGSPAISVDGNTVTVVLSRQMLAVPGQVRASLQFEDAQLNMLTTFPFTINVQANPYGGAQSVQDVVRLQWLEDKLGEWLKKAGESGEFDGPPGPAGKTPEKGVDYFTPAEKQQFEDAVYNRASEKINPAIEKAETAAKTANDAAAEAVVAAEAVRPDVIALKSDLGDNFALVTVKSSIQFIHTTIAENVPVGTKIVIKLVDANTPVSEFTLYSSDNMLLASSINNVIEYTIQGIYPSIKCIVTNNEKRELSYRYIYREICDNTIYGDIVKNQKRIQLVEKSAENAVVSVSGKQDIPYINLINPKDIVPDKSISKYDGSEINNQYWNATGYILLKAHTKYHSYGSYAANFFAFYDAETRQYIPNPDASVIRGNGDYNCTISVGVADVYFRGSLLKKITSLAYISEYADMYYPYGEYDYSFLCSYLLRKISELESETTYKDKKVLVIGDSISTDYYGNYKKWVTNLCDEGFFDAKNVTNSSFPATGFVADYVEGDYHSGTFIERLKSVSNKETYDIVIIFGGINDYINQNVEWGAFTTAVDTFFEYLVQNFYQSRICVFRPLRTFNTFPSAKTGKYQQEYSEYINTVAKAYCLPVLNLTEESGFCPFVKSFSDRWTFIQSGYDVADGVHPNAAYNTEYLSPMIKNFLLTL